MYLENDSGIAIYYPPKMAKKKKPTFKKVGRFGEFAISEEPQKTHSPLNIFQFASLDWIRYSNLQPFLLPFIV